MAKKFLSTEELSREWIAGTLESFWEVLREYKEGFSRVNEHAFWELVSALGIRML